MKLRKKLLIGFGVAALVVVVAVVGIFANLTSIVRTALEKETPGLTFKELEVGWNRVVVTDVRLKRGGREVFKVDALRVYPSLLSIFSDTLHVANIQIEGPYVYVVRNADGSLTLPVPQSPAGKKPSGSTKKAPEESSTAIRIDRIEIEDGKGELLDKSVQGSPAKFAMSDLELTVSRVSLPVRDEAIDFDFSARLEGRRTGRFEASGWYNAKTDSAEVASNLAELFLPHAEPYYRSKRTTAVMSDGALSIDTDVTMKDGKYVAKTRVELGAIAFSREGLFLGVPVVVFRDHLKDQGKPFVVEMELEGSLDDRSRIQQQIVAELVKALARELGGKALTNAAKELSKGIGEQGQNALKGLFGN